ncbi:MAG: peptide-methionine (S)-S-oxide reductase MsrA [Oleiphilaceae bacterium]|nr:peptide-methionine (S)-S-oxide reductase MsrA [Oleiphilaceae bacterium]
MKTLLTALFLTLAALGTPVQAQESDNTAEAIFAGGCFWCMEPPFDELEGVKETIAGFSGGHVASPSYEQVVSGGTGHRESMKVIYDPEVIGYEKLLEVFWRNIDPLDEGGQFCDRGDHYRAGVFAMNDRQMELALASRKAINESGRFDQTVETEILEAENFYRAEEYHQDYYKKNPIRYRLYSHGCGRYSRLEELWGE